MGHRRRIALLYIGATPIILGELNTSSHLELALFRRRDVEGGREEVLVVPPRAVCDKHGMGGWGFRVRDGKAVGRRRRQIYAEAGRWVGWGRVASVGEVSRGKIAVEGQASRLPEAVLGDGRDGGIGRRREGRGWGSWGERTEVIRVEAGEVIDVRKFVVG